MRFILLFILSLFSVNVLAFECTAENTIDYPGYKGEPLKDLGTVIQPTDKPLSEMMAKESHTYCMRGYPYKGLKSQRVLAVVQEGLVSYKGRTDRYVFSFTDGVGGTFALDNFNDMWWDLKTAEWYIFCSKDDFSDETQCMTTMRDYGYYISGEMKAALTVTKPMRPNSEVCFRIDDNKPECSTADKGWAAMDAYELLSRMADGKRIRLRYTNLAGQIIQRDDILHTTYLTRYLTNMIVLKNK